ncbi:MAG: KH domain-containing protein [Candidatus Hermodarchaeota archaeon]
MYDFFFKKTNIYPKCVIVINQFVFFIVNKDLIIYNEVKKHMYNLRRILCKKVAIIKEQSTLIHLLYSLFPDIFIYDIIIEVSNISNERSISIKFLSYEDRAIAVGRNGEYIKAVNQLLEKHILFQNNKAQIKIRCKVANQNEIYQNLNINISS